MISDRIKGPFTINQFGGIDCTYVHEVYGEIPYTAKADDQEPDCREAYAYALARMQEDAE